MNLEQWLEYLERCHPGNIELGLDRITQVADRLPIDFSNTTIITVAGTNGKGSTVAMLAAILEQGGYRSCCYTSPHLLHYNERVRLGGRLATDEELCASFAAVEAVRGEVELTYFEFGTLAAYQLFSMNQPDYIILEVGLGGRLDAVNILDADLAIVTNVALDHTDWLGDTREAIGIEKAGIFRAGKPALTGEINIPSTVLEQAEKVGAKHYGNGSAFQAGEAENGGWHWRGVDAGNRSIELRELPLNDFPLDNCATVLQAITLLAPEITQAQINEGLKSVILAGRFQRVERGYPLVLDVAHNPHAARRVLAQVQSSYPGCRVHLVIAMLADKDYRGVLDIFMALDPVWYVAGIQEERGLDGKILYNYLLGTGSGKAHCFPTISGAFDAAELAVTSGERDTQDAEDAEKAGRKSEAMHEENSDIILVAGSFFTVSAVLELI